MAIIDPLGVLVAKDFPTLMTPEIRALVENFTNELSQAVRRTALEEVQARLRSVLKGDGDVPIPTARRAARIANVLGAPASAAARASSRPNSWTRWAPRFSRC